MAVDPHVAPAGFESPVDAMRAAVVWAEYLEAPILFVNGGN
jgi:hypothetical protein